VCEIVMTYMFLIVILGATHGRAPVGFAGIAIGLALTLIHLISIPVTNTSVNPARSTGPAVFVGGWALGQLWLFWIAPIVGAVLAGGAYRGLAGGSGARGGVGQSGVPAQGPDWRSAIDRSHPRTSLAPGSGGSGTVHFRLCGGPVTLGFGGHLKARSGCQLIPHNS